MGIHRGSNIIRSGLEFAYDTGYSSTFNNSSNYLYNQGEPTANLLDNSDDWSSNWTGNLFSNWINATVTPNAGVAPDGTTTASKLTGGYSRWQRINCSTSTTYTFSFWIKNIDLPIAPQIHIAFGLNGSLVNYNNVTTIALNTIGEWTRVSKTHTSPSSGINQMEVGVTWSSNYPNTDSVLVWHAMCEQNSHMTPFAYKNNDRSATNSLLDITRQSSINLTNVSFDSDAHMTFDGTDDKGEVLNFPAIWNGSVSLETVASWDDDTRSIIFGNYNCNNNDINFEKLTGGSLRFYWGRGARDVTTTGNPRVTTSGAYHHVVFVRDTSANNFKFYVDGTLVTTVSNAGSNITSTGSTFRIGGDTRNGSTIHNGNIPIIRVYSKALTTEEVTQNFSAYRDRFNI